MGIETAILGSAVIGGVASNSAAKKAAKTQQKATDAAIGEQRRQFDLTREDFAPYRETGVNALAQLAGDINAPMSPADVMSDPGYQFGMDQGQQALDRKISAMGGRVSGAALKAAARFGTNYASTGYNAAYQRRQDRLNRLAAIAGIGQTATGASAQAGAGSANQISGLLSSQGDASAAARLSQGNVWGNQANQLAAMYLRRPQTPASGWYDDPSQIPMQPGGGF
jgi:hypothetical protein